MSERVYVTPGNYIRLPRPNGTMGVWEVRSALVGASGQESVYGLRVVDLAHPSDEFGLRITEMYVPMLMIQMLKAQP